MCCGGGAARPRASASHCAETTTSHPDASTARPRPSSSTHTTAPTTTATCTARSTCGRFASWCCGRRGAPGST
eukprot:scaffold1760_cov109-Isochrysis_galbana.AAC.10